MLPWSCRRPPPCRQTGRAPAGPVVAGGCWQGGPCTPPPERWAPQVTCRVWWVGWPAGRPRQALSPLGPHLAGDQRRAAALHLHVRQRVEVRRHQRVVGQRSRDAVEQREAGGGQPHHLLLLPPLVHARRKVHQPLQEPRAVGRRRSSSSSFPVLVSERRVGLQAPAHERVAGGLQRLLPAAGRLPGRAAGHGHRLLPGPPRPAAHHSAGEGGVAGARSAAWVAAGRRRLLCNTPGPAASRGAGPLRPAAPTPGARGQPRTGCSERRHHTTTHQATQRPPRVLAAPQQALGH
jgi:hypothetical protein